MRAADVKALCDYNRWANDRVLATVERLTVEQFTRDLGSSFRSIRDTLVHILGAEWIWLMRWRGTSPKALPPAAEFPTLEALRVRWTEVQAEQERFVAAVTDEALARPVAYVNTKGERWEYPLGRLMQHVVNHSTYHRGQVTTLLRQLGAKPLATDLLVFHDQAEKGGR